MQRLGIVHHLRHVAALILVGQGVLIKSVVYQCQWRGLPPMEAILLFSSCLHDHNHEEQNSQDYQREWKGQPAPVDVHTRVFTADPPRHRNAVVGVTVLPNVHGQSFGNALEHIAEVLELAGLVGEDVAGVVEDRVVDDLDDAGRALGKVLRTLRLGNVAVEVRGPEVCERGDRVFGEIVRALATDDLREEWWRGG